MFIELVKVLLRLVYYFNSVKNKENLIYSINTILITKNKRYFIVVDFKLHLINQS